MLEDLNELSFHLTEDQKKELLRRAEGYRFEYHLFHAGVMYRIGRASHRDVMSLVGEWCRKNRMSIVTGMEGKCVPVYLFMNGVLSGVLEFQSLNRGRMVFRETLVFDGQHLSPIPMEDLRVFEWVPKDAGVDAEEED